jgi:hypothetical protein
MMMHFLLAGALVLMCGCSARGVHPLVVVSSRLSIEGEPQDQTALVQELENFLLKEKAKEKSTYRGRISRFLVEAIESDEISVTLSGCATFGRFLPERYSAAVVKFKLEGGWEWYPLQISTGGLDMPMLPCK